MSETENGGNAGNAAIAVRPAELANRRLEGGLAEGNSVMAPADWQMLAAIAETVKATEFVPAGLRDNGPKVLACMLYGHSLGIHPMVSLKEIAVIDGTPSMSAALMVAKVRERGHTIRREELWEEDEQAVGGRLMVGVTAHGTRADTGETDSYTFTLAMARRAGLMGKKNWQNYPEAMLWHRASSQLCTFLFPDVFMGSPYMPEELGADLAPDLSDVTVEIQQGTPLPQSPAAEAAEAAVSPQEPETVEETQEQPEAPAVAEEHAAPQAEGFWTPLDDREPTDEEYAFAKGLIASPPNTTNDDELEEILAGAQTLIDAYDAAHATVVGGVSIKGTVVEALLRVNELTQANDLTGLRSMLELEQAQSRPRTRLVAGIEEAIALVEAASTQQPLNVEGPGELEHDDQDGEPVPVSPPFQPAASEEAPVVHPLDPSTPFEELTPELAAARVRALLAVIADQEPNPQWTYASVMTSGGKIWQIEARQLEDFGVENLEHIYAAAPEISRRMIEAMPGTSIEKMAAMVPGGDEA